MPRPTEASSQNDEEFVNDVRNRECETVTVEAETSNTKVFSSGKDVQSKGEIPAGGHSEPSSTLGESEQCRYAQKKEAKNMTSERIKRTIERRSPDCTAREWHPR